MWIVALLAGSLFDGVGAVGCPKISAKTVTSSAQVDSIIPGEMLVVRGVVFMAGRTLTRAEGLVLDRSILPIVDPEMAGATELRTTVHQEALVLASVWLVTL